MFPLLQAGLARILAPDPKLMELAYGRVIFETYGAYADADIRAMADQCLPELAGLEAA